MAHVSHKQAPHVSGAHGGVGGRGPGRGEVSQARPALHGACRRTHARAFSLLGGLKETASAVHCRSLPETRHQPEPAAACPPASCSSRRTGVAPELRRASGDVSTCRTINQTMGIDVFVTMATDTVIILITSSSFDTW